MLDLAADVCIGLDNAAWIHSPMQYSAKKRIKNDFAFFKWHCLYMTF